MGVSVGFVDVSLFCDFDSKRLSLGTVHSDVRPNAYREMRKLHPVKIDFFLQAVSRDEDIEVLDSCIIRFANITGAK